MVEVFRKDRKMWTESDQEEVQYVYRCNSFLSPIYETRWFDKISDICFYCKVPSKQKIYLNENKRPAAIILLSGQIEIWKKNINTNSGKKKKNEKGEKEYIKQSQLHLFNQTVTLSIDCCISSLHGSTSEFLFIPNSLYYRFLHNCKEEKDKIIFNLLKNRFHITENKPVKHLVDAGCNLKEYRFNTSIYSEGDKPESVFVILEGCARVEEPNFSLKTSKLVVIGVNAIFGDKDLHLDERLTSVICSSSSIRLLQIPKEPFEQFARMYLPEYKEWKKSQKKQPKRVKSPQTESKMKLPTILRVKSSIKSQKEEEYEHRLIKNCHILLDASTPRNSKIRVSSSFSDHPKDIMKEKLKFYKKIRPNQQRVSLTNRII